jgi:hypothetical protein
MNKIVTIRITNTFSNQDVIEFTMPVHRDKASFGYYSKLLKKAKKNFANQQRVNSEFIKADVSISPGFTDRVTVKTRKGITLNMPADFTAVDLQIIKLHLEAKALTLKN